MNQNDMIAQIAELEARVRADETDWESYIRAGELWAELSAQDPEDDEERLQHRRMVERQIAEHQRAMRPNLLTRLYSRFTKRTAR